MTVKINGGIIEICLEPNKILENKPSRLRSGELFRGPKFTVRSRRRSVRAGHFPRRDARFVHFKQHYLGISLRINRLLLKPVRFSRSWPTEYVASCGCLHFAERAYPACALFELERGRARVGFRLSFLDACALRVGGDFSLS